MKGFDARALRRLVAVCSAIGYTAAFRPAPAQTVPASADPVPILVSTAWLAEHLHDSRVVVIHTGMNRAGYDSVHIPGARYLPYSSFVAHRDGLTTELPSATALDSVLAAIGVSADSRIVIHGPPVVSHRLFLALDVMGFRGQVGMLDGGLAQWRAENRAVTAAIPAVHRGTVSTRLHEGVMVDREWVRAKAADSAFQFVDARMPMMYDRAHLPGAVNVPLRDLLIDSPSDRESWSLVTTDSAGKAFAKGGVRQGKKLVAYCAIGETASVVYFTARYLGLPVWFYDGSMEDWQR